MSLLLRSVCAFRTNRRLVELASKTRCNIRTPCHDSDYLTVCFKLTVHCRSLSHTQEALTRIVSSIDRVDSESDAVRVSHLPLSSRDQATSKWLLVQSSIIYSQTPHTTAYGGRPGRQDTPRRLHSLEKAYPEMCVWYHCSFRRCLLYSSKSTRTSHP